MKNWQLSIADCNFFQWYSLFRPSDAPESKETSFHQSDYVIRLPFRTIACFYFNSIIVFFQYYENESYFFTIILAFFHKIWYYNKAVSNSTRGISSAGRAPHWQCGGQRFDPAMLHHIENPHGSRACGFFAVQKSWLGDKKLAGFSPASFLSYLNCQNL